jgi:hypothetical protein
MASRIYLDSLIDEHDSGDRHLDLHQPVCVGFQFKDGVIFGNYSTPFLLLNMCSSVNAGYDLQAGL